MLPDGVAARPVRDLTKLTDEELAAAFDTPNGPTRDLIQARFAQLGVANTKATETLRRLAKESGWPATRAHALATLEVLQALDPADLAAAIKDPHPGVRRVALGLGEPFYQTTPALLAAAASLADDADAAVRYQLALSLGEAAASPLAARALGRLAVADMADPWMRAAILSSSSQNAGEVLEAVLATPAPTRGRTELASGLIATAVAAGDEAALARIAGTLASGVSDDPAAEAWRFAAWAEFFQALERRQLSAEAILARASQGESAAPLRQLWETATALAFDVRQPLPARQSALSLCALRPDLSRAQLIRLNVMFENTVEEPLRPTALAALRRQPTESLAAVLLADWPHRSPAARAAFVELMMEREDTLAALLTALENGTVSGAEIPVPRRERFLQHTDASIKTRAEKIFAPFQPRQRAEVLAAYQSVASLKGDEAKGREVFQTACAICHRARGLGHEVGPDLAAFSSKGVPEFLEAILNPNGIIEPRFLTYTVELKDGRSLAGLVGNETATSLTLRQAAGLQESVTRAEIKAMKASPLSLMPEGLEHAVPPAAMADLIAFLKSGVPKPFGNATAESAATARQTFGPGQASGLALITEAAEFFDYVSWLGRLPFAHCRQTDGTQKIVWRTAPAPAEIKAEEMHDFRFPGGLGYLSQPAGTFTLSLNGSKALTFGVELAEREWASADGSVRLRYEPKEVGPEDSNGIFTLSVRGAKLVAGQPLTLQVVGSPSQSQRWFGVYAFSAGQVQLTQKESDLPLARQIIAPQTPNARRIEIIQQHPERLAEFLQDMVSDLQPGTPEEYRRIPWIWHVTIAAGKRNDAAELKRLLEISLPQEGQPLRDWECVVLGGGLINGVSQLSVWPLGRFRDIIGNNEALTRRWQHALEEAFVMADNEKVPHGTRYDALRMTPLLPWEKAKSQLARYVGKDVNAELQQGAVSGLADAEHPEAAQMLIAHFADFTDGNKNFALDALLRGPERTAALLDAIASGTIPPAALGAARREKLLEHSDPTLRERARAVLGQP